MTELAPPSRISLSRAAATDMEVLNGFIEAQ
jgi:hypothetical protein